MTEVAECQYRKYDKLLFEQFTSGLNDDGMVNEILKEVAMLEDVEDGTSSWVLLWAYRVKGQRGWKSAHNEIKEAKEFDLVNCSILKQVHDVPRANKRNDNCKYCSIWHAPAVPFILKEL